MADLGSSYSTTGGTGGGYDDQAILATIATWAQMPGANPSLARDPNYWLGRIKQTGGLRADNLQYWQGLGMRPEGAPEGGGSPSAQSGGGAPMPSGGPPPLPAPYQTPTFTAPAPYTPPTFTPPTGVTEQNDPGFQFRIEQGQKALQGAAASKGSLLSGGTLKALDRYTEDYASGEFGNVYNRALSTFGTNAQLGQQGYLINAANTWKPQELQAQYGLAGYQTNLDAAQGQQRNYYDQLLALYQGGLTGSGSTYQQPPA